jgi:hypothetical protein
LLTLGVRPIEELLFVGSDVLFHEFVGQQRGVRHESHLFFIFFPDTDLSLLQVLGLEETLVEELFKGDQVHT